MTWAAWCGRSNLGTRSERSPRPVIVTSSNWNGRRRSSSGSTSLWRRTCNPSPCCASIPKWSAARLTACGVSGPRETPGRSSVRWILCAAPGSGRTTLWTAWSTVSGPPQRSANAAIQEDADAVGLSILSGAHMTLLPRLLDLLRQKGGGEIVVFAGGIIPEEDIPTLRAAGVSEIFLPGASLDAIVRWVREHVKP